MIKSILKGKETTVDPKFLHRLFEENKFDNRSLYKPALIFEDELEERQTTYFDLNQIANQLARQIQNVVIDNNLQSNGNGDWVVGVCMNISDYLVMTVLAIWKAGATYLPINPQFPQNRIEHILQEAKPSIVIYDDFFLNPEYFQSAYNAKFDTLLKDSEDLNSHNISDEHMLIKGCPTAFIFYTSGASGYPQGIRIPHHTFYHRIMWHIDSHPYGESEEKCVFQTSLASVDHVGGIFLPLISGKTLIIVRKEIVENSKKFVDVLEKYQIERVHGVPALLREVLMYLNSLEDSETKSKLACLRMWISSGETLTLSLAKDFFKYFDHGRQKLVNFYGCTEVNCNISSYEIETNEQLMNLVSIPLGVSCPNTMIYIFNGDKHVAKEGDVGEIHVAGVAVAAGYVNEETSSHGFMKNPFENEAPYSSMYNTGDLGFIKQGLLYFAGRNDTQIKVRGQRVEIAEIEKHVSDLNFIEQSAILVHHAGHVDQALVAFVKLEINSSKSPTDIENELNLRLPRYMVPRIVLIEDFPKLPNGKVNRKELLKIYKKQSETNTKSYDTGMGLEQIRDDNIYESGDKSLNMMSTISKLNMSGTEIGITDFLKAQNLGELLNYISVKDKKEDKNIDVTLLTDMKLYRVSLNFEDQKECIDLLADSFLDRGDLDRFIKDLKLDHYVEIFERVWPETVTQGLSFVVKNEADKILGVALCYYALDEPPVYTSSPLKLLFDFIASIEEPIIEKKIAESFNPLLHCLFMATDENLATRDNIALMLFLESEVINTAKQKHFRGIVTTNTNLLSQQFSELFFDYQTEYEICLNKYVEMNGNRPFETAADNSKALVMFREISDE
ncbi:CLUMA_CG001558, isoform A [Clunio marinus]|uniref:CLUMA_CG001558, isoform A n=1 Tax=Clunio marinus TaxID=568069 RepID=A0A1J1HJQ2_9DIPT|nr:CLUMA_CG001558, isoform A [Clunio marinus]